MTNKILIAASLALTSFAAEGQVTSIMPVTNPGIYQAAQQSSNALSSGAKMNMLIGVMMLSQCMNAKPPNTMMCMIGMMALMQGMQMQNSANATQNAIAASSSSPVVLTSSIPPSIPQTPGVTAGLNYLGSSGYQVSPNGVKMPNGSILPVKAFESPTALASLGFSPKDVEQAQTAYSSARAQAFSNNETENTASRSPASEE